MSYRQNGSRSDVRDLSSHAVSPQASQAAVRRRPQTGRLRRRPTWPSELYQKWRRLGRAETTHGDDRHTLAGRLRAEPGKSASCTIRSNLCRDAYIFLPT